MLYLRKGKGLYGIGGRQRCLYDNGGNGCVGNCGTGGKEHMEKEESGRRLRMWLQWLQRSVPGEKYRYTQAVIN